MSTFFVVLFHTGGDSVGRIKGSKNRKWSVEEKLRIINRHLDEHQPMRQIAQEEQISCGMLSHWVSRYLEGGITALAKRPGNPYAATQNRHLSEEDRLRLIIAKQEVEIARLKKGYFVKGVGANKEYVTGKEKTMKSSRL